MGSYSKAMAVMLLSTIVPFYAFMLVGLFYIAYFFWFMGAGAIIAISAVIGITIYGMLHYQTYANLGTTIQYEDNRDKYEDITWTGDVPIMGPFVQQDNEKHEQSFYVATIKDDSEREWLIFFRHHFGQLGFSAADVIKEWSIAKIRTSYITCVHLKTWSRAKADEEIKRPSWFERHLLHKPLPDTHLPVTALYAYGTTVTARDVLALFNSKKTVQIIPPMEKTIDEAFKHYGINQLWLVMDETKAKDQTIDDLHKLAMDESELKIDIGKEMVNEPETTDWKGILKWLAIGAVIIVVILAVYKYLGII